MESRLRRLAGTVLALVIPLPAVALPERPVTGLAGSVALADEAQALLVNPAGLAFRDGYQGLFTKGWASSGEGSVLLSAGGLAFGYEQGSQTTGDWQRGSLGLGLGLLPGLSVGLAGRAGQSGGGFTTLDAGLMWRPSDYVSLGLSAQDLTNPRVDGAVRSRRYLAGIALRPGTDRVSLAVDLGWREGDPLSRLQPRAEVLAEPAGGIRLRGAIDLAGNAEVGLAIGWHHGEVGHSQGSGGTAPASFVALHGDYVRPFWDGERSRIAELDLRGPIVAQVSRGLFGGTNGQSLFEVLEELKTAREAPEIAGVVLRLGGTSASWAAFDEFRQALADLQAAGKKVVAYLYGVNTPEYFLACQADRVVMHPLGELAVRGLSLQVSHYKGLLDKLGIQADFVRVGDYKAAIEPMTLDSMSPANRRQLEAVLEDGYDRLIKAVAAGRHLPPAKIRELIDQGTFTAKAAKAEGLVDTVAYEDEVVKQTAGLFGRELAVVRIGDRVPHRTAWQDPDRIAVIAATGAITEGRSGRNLLSGEFVLGADTLVKAIRLAAQDGRVRAVVLRVDSPGGSVIASDMVWRELIKLKEAGKPLIISMGEVAASGGYWIATPADRIVADPGTLTGSIGVFAGKLSFGGLYDKLGIRQEVLKRGERADAETDARPFTEAERAALKASIESTYGVFLDRVAAARGLSREAVDSLGRGRVYTGAQAKQARLVDELGGLATAVEIARVMGRFPTHRVEVVAYPDPESVLATLLDNEISVSLQPMIVERLRHCRVMALMPESRMF